MAVVMPSRRNVVSVDCHTEIIFDESNKRMRIPLDDDSIDFYKKIQTWFLENTKDKVLDQKFMPELIDEKYIWIRPMPMRYPANKKYAILEIETISPEDQEIHIQRTLDIFSDFSQMPYWKLNEFHPDLPRNWNIDILVVPKILKMANSEKYGFVLRCEKIRLQHRRLLYNRRMPPRGLDDRISFKDDDEKG